jgi:hypothetical protein
MKTSSIMVGVLALFLFVSVQMGIPASALAQGHPGGPHGPGFLNGLTQEQREAVHDRIAEMRDQGATREDIHTAVAGMLEAYGVDVPERWSRFGGFGHPWGEFWADLTEDQREAVREKIAEMREQGATREEIHTAASQILEGYGIKLPENWGPPEGPRGFGHGPGGFWVDLTQEQRQAIQDKMEEMREQGATREEIHTVITEMLEGYGIELPEKGFGWHGPRGFGPWGECFGVGLTEDQKKTIREKKREMRGQGATREEIHAAVAAMLKSYGIELPEFLGQLTEEQRRTIGKTVREMKRKGAACEEIRAAVAEMLQEYGYEVPEQTEDSISEMEPAKSIIVTRSYPNPFNPVADIAYTLSVSENVEVRIYNVSGQLIRTFDLGYQPAGTYSVRWDGCNENGDLAASGVYLYRIEAGPYQVTDRMVLLK